MFLSLRSCLAACLVLLALPAGAALRGPEGGAVPGAEAPAPAPEARRLAQADPEPAAAGPATGGAPALALGLNGVTDWSSQHPFVDIFKTSRAWIGHLPGQWGGIEAEELRAGGHIDAAGWPVSLPDRAERLEALILTDQPEEATGQRGYYILTHAGRGEITLTGRARRVDDSAPGRLRFFYEPGPGAVGVSISALDPEDPIRDIKVYREEHAALIEAGAMFNPAWLSEVSAMRVLRFMDWQATNDSTLTDWDDRPRPGDASYMPWGVPLEVLIRLANEVGADPWVNVPHGASDGYVRAMAEMLRDGLDPRLKAHVEYSNEVWNEIFEQARWAEARARDLWGPGEDLKMQYYGLRAAQVMDIFAEVYGPERATRLVRVFATQTGWMGREARALTAPLAYLTLGRMPRDSFDAYAVTGYFPHGAKKDIWSDLSRVLDAAEAEARAAGEAEGLARVALREHIRATRFEAAYPVFAKMLEPGIDLLTEEVFPYHAAVAAEAGLDLIMYEGGAHLVAAGTGPDEERIAEFLAGFGQSEPLAGLYTRLLSGWAASGGVLFNAFVDVGAPSRWGIWGHLRFLGDTSPRWEALGAYNAAGPLPDARPASVFADGALAAGSAGDDEMRGSSEEDVLLGGPGDDLLISGGGADLLHGGPGMDEARLPGARADYALTEDAAGRTLATAGWRRVTLTGIERLSFEAEPGESLPLP
ncbi:hypothetical protein LR948_08625 [Roseivivax sp. GX 12232]|uniref:hypothetical protein n=1 Tax=Roseivivax sp. GX 12232 TaxID=2900547 RepID=UPI001E36BD53|nr:hypothetical protein [Roseivivax sp. GX 12232]MCE0505413.1 hypothetical protein [Roseivivax sp. GX 12232]